MTNKKTRMLGLVLATLVILIISSAIGYFIAAKVAVSNSKKVGKEINYLPEKITKLETEYKSRTGIHFRGESGKLYRCNNAEEKCEEISPEPPKYEDKTPFVETKGVYGRFTLPPAKPKQTVFRRSRGLVGHQTATQYVLLNDGKVWFWHYSGNDMGDSFPFWHLNNIATLLLGVFGGLVVGLIISALVWFGFYPRS